MYANQTTVVKDARFVSVLSSEWPLVLDVTFLVTSNGVYLSRSNVLPGNLLRLPVGLGIDLVIDCLPIHYRFSQPFASSLDINLSMRRQFESCGNIPRTAEVPDSGCGTVLYRVIVLRGHSSLHISGTFIAVLLDHLMSKLAEDCQR